jgi:hypothetical protein
MLTKMRPSIPGNETAQHWLLKRLALQWAYERGFNCISFEVRAPRSSFRVDIAGYRPSRERDSPVIALFECKQSRPDLERDSGQTASIENELRSLQQRREHLDYYLSITQRRGLPVAYSRSGIHLTLNKSATPVTIG